MIFRIVAACWTVTKFGRILVMYIVCVHGNSPKAWPNIQNKLKHAVFLTILKRRSFGRQNLPTE